MDTVLNTDRLQTVLGIVKAGLISGAGVLYAAMHDPNGFDASSPVLWVSVVLGVVEGVKGYFAAGVKPAKIDKEAS